METVILDRAFLQATTSGIAIAHAPKGSTLGLPVTGTEDTVGPDLYEDLAKI